MNEMKRFNLITIGRATIDLNAVEYNRPMEETMTFRKYVGGSPVNIAIGSARMGLKVGFIGKLSKDQHGFYIKNYLEESNINTDNVIFDEEGHKSGLTFTEIKSPSECSILMYRENVADLYLRPEEINPDYIKQTEYLLISGTGLAQSPSREALLKTLMIAKESGIKVIFELDYRPYTWKSEEETSYYYEFIARQVDIIIGTRDEFDIMENRRNGKNKETVERMFKYSPELVLIKHGIEGSFAYEKNGKIHRAKAYKAKVLKTFGAGDSYASAFITALVRGMSIDSALKYGSAAAAIVVGSHSSSEAMPTIEKIERLIEEDKINK